MTGLPLGSAAPDFTLRDQHGTQRTLADLLARGPGLLVFFPWVFTPVCGGELAALRDRSGELIGAGLTVFGISCDPMSSLRTFDDRSGVGFPLLSDFWPHGAVAAAYEVFDGELGCARRSTYLVDSAGVVRFSVHNPMGEPRDIDDYLRAAAELEG